MILNVPEWGVVLSLLALAFVIAGAFGAVYLRIGNMEGTIKAKLNGNLDKLTTDVTLLKDHMTVIRTEFPVIRDETISIKENCVESAVTRFQLTQDIISIKQDIGELMSQVTKTTRWDGLNRRLGG
jgi:hypothetical protein